MRTAHRQREGFTLVAVLALLALVGALIVGWTRHALRQNQQARSTHQHCQAEWLAHAAIGRAKARLFAEPDYQGETWRVAADQLAQAYDARVEIEVTSDQAGPMIQAVVHLPAKGDRRVQHTQTLKLNNPSEEESP